jgi:hypothetical protein
MEVEKLRTEEGKDTFLFFAGLSIFILSICTGAALLVLVNNI